MTCGRTQEFLAEAEVDTAEIVDARKRRLALKDALALIDDADELYSAKGRRLDHVDLRQGRPDRATIARLMLGPTGSLRAPTLRVGRTLIVGFDEATYQKVFGAR